MASTIKVDTIDTPSGAGNITISRPIVADISSVTGTLPSAVFPATLPVLNGSNLTGITHTPADNSVTGAKLNISLLAGDTMYASGTDTLAKLAKGTATQVLTMNTGATAPEWADAGGGSWEWVETVVPVAASNNIWICNGNVAVDYDYLITWQNINNTTYDAPLSMRLGQGSSSDISANYKSASFYAYIATSSC